jgi:hypothetical protein
MEEECAARNRRLRELDDLSRAAWSIAEERATDERLKDEAPVSHSDKAAAVP